MGTPEVKKPAKPRKPLSRSRFETKLLRRRRPNACQCWSCLRREGLTPPRALADRHRDYPDGKIYRTDTGTLDHQANKALAAEEKAAAATRATGMDERRK